VKASVSPGHHHAHPPRSPTGPDSPCDRRGRGGRPSNPFPLTGFAPSWRGYKAPRTAVCTNISSLLERPLLELVLRRMGAIRSRRPSFSDQRNTLRKRIKELGISLPGKGTGRAHGRVTDTSPPF